MSGLEGSTISGVTPGSTTAQLAGKVPKETREKEGQEGESSDIPGGYPETPFHDAQEFSVNPIPASSGTGNPIDLKPGEKVPDQGRLNTNEIEKGVTLDKESYDKAGSGIQSDATDATAGGAFGVPPVSKGMIPESSLPMGSGSATGDKDMGPQGTSGLVAADSTSRVPVASDTIQSAGAGTSTAALAANVPKEPRGNAQVMDGSEGTGGTAIAPTVPDVVQESIAESKSAPEAAANKEAVKEKSAVENELLKEVKTSESKGEPAPATSAAVAETAPASTDKTATDSAPQITTKDAPADTPAAKNAMAQAVQEQHSDSRDVSPLSPRTQDKPTVTTGVASSKAPPTSQPASTSKAPESPVSKSSANASSPADKKGRRGSGFFGKLKEKFKHHDKQ